MTLPALPTEGDNDWEDWAEGVHSLAGSILDGLLGVNVKKYGAVGNGSTDDTDAIQAALDALPTHGTLFFPPGIYVCSDELTVPSYVTFLGVGKASQINYTGAGSWITLTSQREVKWARIYVTASDPDAVLFTLSNCFRCSWHSVYMNGAFVGPKNSGAYLDQTAVVLTANSGDNMFYDCDITNFGIGLKTDCIQNAVVGGKFGTNNISIYGFGGGGMALSGYIDFVSGLGLVDTHIDIDGATGQWWLSDIWMEGADTGIKVGTAGVNGPSQFGMTNCKVAASVIALDIQFARNPTIINVQLNADPGATTAQALAIDGTSAPEGVLFADTLISGGIDLADLPIGWLCHIRDTSQSHLRTPNYLDFPYGASFRMSDSGGTYHRAFEVNASSVLLVRGATTGTGSAVRLIDSSGKTLAEFNSVTNMVNYVRMTGATTGNPAVITATGTDTDVNLQLAPRGAGMVLVEGSGLRNVVKATGSRPSASGRAGLQIFDSTLNKPIWSDGTNWRDAAGTVV